MGLIKVSGNLQPQGNDSVRPGKNWVLDHTITMSVIFAGITLVILFIIADILVKMGK